MSTRTQYEADLAALKGSLAKMSRLSAAAVEEALEALCPDGRSIPLDPEWIKNEAGELVESTPHAMERYTIPTPELPPMSLLRRKV